MRIAFIILLWSFTLIGAHAQSSPLSDGQREVSNDSLLRWQQWRDLGEWSSRQFDHLSWSLGGLGRSSAIYTSWATPNSDRLRWNGILLNNPITGQFNPSEVPFDQIATMRSGLSGWSLQPRRYSVSKPLTYVSYEQGKDQARVLDAELALPVTDNIKFQASYQGTKEVGNYARSEMMGRRSTGHMEISLGSNWRLSPFWLYQGAEMEESLGYVFDEPDDFSFDRFRAQARSGNTRSMRRLMLSGIHIHTAGSSQEEGLRLYRKLHRFEWRGPDAHWVRSVEWGMSATQALIRNKWIELRPFVDLSSLELERDPVGAKPEQGIHYRVGSNIGAKPVSFLSLHAAAEAGGWADRSGRALEAGLQVDLPYGAKVDAQLLSSTVPRQLGSWLGQVGANGEGLAIDPQYTALDLRLGRYTGVWRYALGYRVSRSDGDLFMKTDQTVEAITGLESQYSFVNLEYHSDSWEFGAHHRLLTILTSDQPMDPNHHRDEQRFQLFGYWKGPVIKSAAYLKMGFIYTQHLSDFYAPIWYAKQGLWIQGLDQRVPAFNRLDLELAARVRSMILTAKLENTLDGWTQKGYFETLPYPQYGRHLRLGLKVIFRD